MVRKHPARAARAGSSTPLIVNQSQGNTFSVAYAAPAEANTSPSPLASITTSASTAKRPDLAWNVTPVTRSRSTSASHA